MIESGVSVRMSTFRRRSCSGGSANGSLRLRISETRSERSVTGVRSRVARIAPYGDNGGYSIAAGLKAYGLTTSLAYSPLTSPIGPP